MSAFRSSRRLLRTAAMKFGEVLADHQGRRQATARAGVRPVRSGVLHRRGRTDLAAMVFLAVEDACRRFGRGSSAK